MTTAADRGWGPGWPSCQTDKWEWYTAAGHRWLLRREAAPVLTAFIRDFHDLIERIDPAQSWSAACRPIRGTTDEPSEHSWAKAVDLNAAKHPRGSVGTFTAVQVLAIRGLLARPAYRNIRWGADFDHPDEHHFEYVGTPEQADADARLLTDPEDDMDEATLRAVVREEIAAVRTDLNKKFDRLWDETSIIRAGDDDPAPGDQRPAEPGLKVLWSEIKAIRADITELKGRATVSGGVEGDWVATFRRPE